MSQEKYVMRFKGNLDFRELIVMKHPLQAMLRKGGAPTVQLKVVKDETAFVIEGYYGTKEALEENLAKLVPKLHIHTALAKAYMLEQLTEQQSTQIEAEGADVQNIKDEMAILDSIVADNTERELWYQEEVEKAKEEIERAQKRSSGLDKTIKSLGQKEKISTENYKSARQEIERLIGEREKLYSEIAGLSKHKISSPEECALQEISSYASSLQKIALGLDDLVEGAAPQEVESWLDFGKQDLVKILEEEAAKIGCPLGAINESPGKFEDTTFYKENSSKYSEAKTAAQYWSEIEGRTPEFLKAAIKGALKLDASKEIVVSFEKEQSEFNKKYEAYNKINELREKHVKAKEFSGKIDQTAALGKIPCLLLRANGESRAYFPNSNSKYLGDKMLRVISYDLAEGNTSAQNNFIEITFETGGSPELLEKLTNNFRLTEITKYN
jgi:hypothetical protein